MVNFVIGTTIKIIAIISSKTASKILVGGVGNTCIIGICITSIIYCG
jgi:hypothetical protein